MEEFLTQFFFESTIILSALEQLKVSGLEIKSMLLFWLSVETCEDYRG